MHLPRTGDTHLISRSPDEVRRAQDRRRSVQALTEEFLREIAPLLGDQLEIKRVLDATQLKVSSVRVVFFA